MIIITDVIIIMLYIIFLAYFLCSILLPVLIKKPKKGEIINANNFNRNLDRRGL